ncbi:MAG TPA: MoxR family ATPase [Kineosporiaceae bacterium]|nr:MoxR family ATPase [Kineosporiaceae bacterium]
MTTSTGAGYRPLFDPDAGPPDQPFDASRAYRLGDRSPTAALPYVYDERITLAVNTALAAGRPLLVRGHPGTGKSSLARSVADKLGWRFYARTISSRTAARDLLWSFDTVARLADAQALPQGSELPPRGRYIVPGPLWWAFHPASARDHGADPTVTNPGADRAVVLVDEIDKADPDVPNDLLVPLGSYYFEVDDGPRVVAAYPPLVVITTNEERELPRAFLRRCVILALDAPGPDRLRSIAEAHFPGLDAALLGAVQASYASARAERIEAGEPPPSVAELLDALAACSGLRVDPQDPHAGQRWGDMVKLLLAKVTTIPPEEP